MARSFIIALILVISSSMAFSQRGFDGYTLKGEYGVTVGAANYFGDLNTRSGLSRVKPAIGIFYTKQYNDYLSIRISGHYAQVGYSDVYSKNVYQLKRNLSFNSDIWQFAVHGDFNFFKFLPGDSRYAFTPFISLGIGTFSYNPYAYLADEKIYLRPLGTEGQNINYVGPDGKKRTPYGTNAISFPIGAGIKYNLTKNINLTFLITHHLTTTDYLDDVSTTYVGINNFNSLSNGQFSTAAIMQDRSYEKGAPIGVEGRQRGWSKQRDQFVIAEVGLSFNINTYSCPSNF